MKFIVFVSQLFLLCNFSYSQNVKKSMKRLPDTGEVNSYTSTFGEDNDYTIYPPFFIANGNGTVTDTITNLMWQQTDGGEMSIESAQLYCDSLNLAGFSDWRLPSAYEAFSILNHQYSNPALDITVFPKTLAEYWWTSDKQVNDVNKVWATNSGGGIGNHPKIETISAGGVKRFHVRAVRDIGNIELINNRYSDNGNGTIVDNFTGLIWQKSLTADSLTWEQALSYSDTLSYAGINDWRLPNIKELQSINDETRIKPSLDTKYFNINNSKKYWSSTTLPNQITKAWYLDTQYGVVTYDFKTLKHNIILVSGNQISTGIVINRNEFLTAYPNPFSTFIHLNIKSQNTQYILTNTFGEVIFIGNNIELHDFSSLAQGIYFLKIIDKASSIIKLSKI